jgi:acyl-CoA synthetase (AMP-forming)/AMP-acid ligase II
VDDLARVHPDVEAVVDLTAGRQALSWCELSRRSCEMARFFLDRGAIDGSTVVVQQRLAPYKVPKTLEFVHGIERTTAGKVNRSALAAARDRRDL